MTSYVLLAFYQLGNLVEGIGLMKWLSEQRNHLGSYGTTQVMRHRAIDICACVRVQVKPANVFLPQDTITALQALAYYSAFSGAKAINLGLRVSTPSSPLMSQLYINSTNFLAQQSQEASPAIATYG